MTVDAQHPLPGSRPLVVGAARSGRAAARLLARHGLEVRLCDRRDGREEATSTAELAALGVEIRWGADDPTSLEDRDFLVWSPGIPLAHSLAAAARARRLPILSELELGARAAHAPLVCVTGTNGKSTTTDLLRVILAAAGREVEACGNIGRAICEVAEEVGPTGLLAVEVSSFQLESVERIKPLIAVWLNLKPDHLDRHGDFDTYGALKRRLFERQDENDYAVWNGDDPEVTKRRAGAGVPLEFSMRRSVGQGAFAADGEIRLAWRGGTERLMAVGELRLPGSHNLMNILAALAATLPLEISPSTLRWVLSSYAGLEHRLETVAVVDGIRYVNDSKATNLDSLEVALLSCEDRVVLIAGGRDKGQDFRPLRELVQRTVRTAFLIGEGADRIADAWSGVRTERAGSLADAVDLAHRAAQPGETVLFSPGCASFDMFRDYEDRGRCFKAEVTRRKLPGART